MQQRGEQGDGKEFRNSIEDSKKSGFGDGKMAAPRLCARLSQA
jgi:hypothetical protein